MKKQEIIDYCAQRSFLDRERLESLWFRAEEAVSVKGDFVECGCGPGGSSGILAGFLDNADLRKRLIVCDTFEGLPPPEQGVDEAEGWSWDIIKGTAGSAKGTVKQIADICQKTGPRVTVNCVKGLYADTLTLNCCGPIALLHIDCDWHYSVNKVLESLYPSVSPGGIVILDDYHFWSGCMEATLEYFAANPPLPPLNTVSVSVWLRKPIDAPASAKIPPSTPAS